MIDEKEVISRAIATIAEDAIKDTAKYAWDKVKKFFKDLNAQDSIRYRTAYQNYLTNTKNRNGRIKTIIHRHVPKELYDFYECVGIRYNGKDYDTSTIKNILEIGNRVLIIDCDRLRSIDLFLGVTAELVYDFGDVIKKNCEPEAAVYESNGVGVVSCPLSYDGIDEAKMRKLVEEYDYDYNFILFDAPAGIDTGLIIASAAADSGIVVSTPDLVCVRSACAAAREMEKLGVQQCRLVINRAHKKDITKGRLLNVDKVIDSTQVQLIGVVPEDAKIRMGSMGADVYKKGQASYKAITNIAGRILGEYVPLS